MCGSGSVCVCVCAPVIPAGPGFSYTDSPRVSPAARTSGGTLDCWLSEGLGLLPSLEPRRGDAAHQRVVFIWIQLQLPEAFAGVGPRPREDLYVARLES